MIVTCPACATRYLIDPRALGIGGRTVRCTHCGQTWTQAPAEDAPRRVDLPPPGAIAVPPPRPPPPPPRPRPVPVSAPNVGDEAVAYASKPVRAPARRGGGAIPIAVILGVILGVLWYGREFIMAEVPALSPVYAALGLAADAQAGLEFRRVTSNRVEQDGRPTLVIEGEVANVSHAARRVPPVRVTLEDADKHPLRSWMVTTTRDRLRPGETAAFHSSIADPGGNSAGASVAFATGAD
jgi:predicted Zn finger-like uncharacterized protein